MTADEDAGSDPEDTLASEEAENAQYESEEDEKEPVGTRRSLLGVKKDRLKNNKVWGEEGKGWLKSKTNKGGEREKTVKRKKAGVEREKTSKRGTKQGIEREREDREKRKKVGVEKERRPGKEQQSKSGNREDRRKNN